MLQTVMPPTQGTTKLGSPTKLTCSSTSFIFSPDTTKYKIPYPNTGGSTFTKNFSIISSFCILRIRELTAPPDIPNSIPICLSDSLQLFNNLLRICMSKLSIMSLIVPPQNIEITNMI